MEHLNKNIRTEKKRLTWRATSIYYYLGNCTKDHGTNRTGSQKIKIYGGIIEKGPFAQAVWNQILTWKQVTLPPHLQPQNLYSSSLTEWWEAAAATQPKETRHTFNGMVIHIWWNIWKEWNRRIFQQHFLPAVEVASQTKEDILQRRRAMLF